MDTEAPTDLRSILSQVTDEAEAASQPRVETPETPAETPAEPSESGKSERVRDEHGRFVKTDDKGQEEVEGPDKSAGNLAGERKPEEAPKDPKPETGDPASAAAPQAGPEAPQHWSQADKQKFAALPAEAKAPFLDMYKRLEGWYTPKLQRLSQVEAEYGPIEQMFAPHREALKARGQAPADIIRMWGNVEQTLVNHKGAVDGGQTPTGDAAAAIARMIAGYRISPQAVADALNAMAQGRAPVVQSVSAQPATVVDPQLKQELEWLKQRELDREAAANQEKLNSVSRQIDTFANEKDSEGNLAHPFFAEVEEDMKVLAAAVRAAGHTPELSDLYNRAVWANPATRDKLLSLQKEQEAKRVAVARKADAEAARRAAVSVSGSPGGTTRPSTGNPNRPLRQMLEDTAAELDAA